VGTQVEGGWMTLTLAQEQSKSEYCSEHPFLMDVSDGEKKCAGGIYSAGTISEKRTKNTFISKHMNTGQKEYGHLFIPKNRAKCSIEHKQKKNSR
jgi:hypothetical protein